MRTVDQIEALRRAYFIEEKSGRAVAREVHHGRRVVREAIVGVSPPPRRYRLTRRQPRPIRDPVVAIIDGWLTADQTAPRTQRHTAKRIYDRLVAEHGVTGSESGVRR